MSGGHAHFVKVEKNGGRGLGRGHLLRHRPELYTSGTDGQPRYIPGHSHLICVEMVGGAAA